MCNMKSTIGRPRALTDLQVAAILAWHAQILEWKAKRSALKTQRQLALELGVSPATISHVVKCAGKFKQPSPEKRIGEQAKRQRRFAHLRNRGFV
jgi:hypothetical protein